MKQFFSILSVIIVGAGVYLKFFYDVPDAQESINFFVSWFLIIVGIAGFLITIFWSSPKHTHNNDHA